MVLQQQPQRAQVWGYADTEGSVVTVILGGIPTATVNTTVVYNEGLGRNVWKVLLPPMPPSGPHTTHTLQAKGKDGTSVLLDDVLFGDVWLCSGQSNMQFTLDMVREKWAPTWDFQQCGIFTWIDSACAASC